MSRITKQGIATALLGCGLGIATLPALAQDAASQSPQSSASQQESDMVFLRHASEGGLAEVQFGQLAAQKAQNPDVKNFGQKMVEDHTMLNDKMKPIAQNLGVTPASRLNGKDQAEYTKLSGLSGDAFDKEYVADMVADHRKDLREFRHEVTIAADPQLRDAVTSATKVIAEHNRMIDQIAQQIGVPIPRRTNSTAQAPSR